MMKPKPSPGSAAISLLALLVGCGPQPGSGSGAETQPQTDSAVASAEPGSEAEAKPGMVRVVGGTFLMGDEDEVDAAPHEVTVSSFLMDTHLVTQAQFEKVTGENPSRWKAPENPVEQVRWSDAVRYCNKRSELEGLELCYDLTNWTCDFDANGYRLPTEAEWEYACRAGTGTAYYFGEKPTRIRDFAWFEKNSGGHPRPVGQKKPNAWGLYDMAGNVWEWCNDFYQVDYYDQSPKEDPRGPAEGKTKVVRGGAWRFSAEDCRSGYRYNESPGYADVCFGYDIYGFRCVRNGSRQEGTKP